MGVILLARRSVRNRSKGCKFGVLGAYPNKPVAPESWTLSGAYFHVFSSCHSIKTIPTGLNFIALSGYLHLYACVPTRGVFGLQRVQYLWWL